MSARFGLIITRSTGWTDVNIVQDDQWEGELIVHHFVAENAKELVAECVCQDKVSHLIVHFLVVEKSQVVILTRGKIF
jgi:hypothetical protein